MFVNPVDLENLFCQIDADSLNVHDGRSAQVVTIYHPTVAQDVGGDHFINKAYYNRYAFCQDFMGYRQRIDFLSDCSKVLLVCRSTYKI